MVKSIFGFFLVVHFWIQYTGLRVRTETLISGRSHLDSSLFSRSSRCRWVDSNMDHDDGFYFQVFEKGFSCVFESLKIYSSVYLLAELVKGKVQSW